MNQLALILSSLSIVFSMIGIYFMHLTQKVRKENDEACREWREIHSIGEEKEKT